MTTQLLPEGVSRIGADPASFFRGGGREFIKKGANLPTSVDVHARESFLLPGA